MAHTELHRKALELRNQGKSYSQIRSEIGVSKSTLSDWLKKFPLSREQIRLLRDLSEVRIEKYRQTMKLKRENKLNGYFEEEKRRLLPLSERELFLAGLFLYWGEGGKSQRHTVSINNTDPTVIKFALYWMVKCLKIPKGEIHVFLHLYNDMDFLSEIMFWSKELQIPISNFDRPYIKESTRTSLDQKGFGHGTCGVRTCDTVIKERLMMGIRAVAEYYEAKINQI